MMMQPCSNVTDIRRSSKCLEFQNLYFNKVDSKAPIAAKEEMTFKESSVVALLFGSISHSTRRQIRLDETSQQNRAKQGRKETQCSFLRRGGRRVWSNS